MTYRDDFTLPTEFLEQISQQGFEYLPEMLHILVNAAMQAERQQHLGAGPYERTPERPPHPVHWRWHTHPPRAPQPHKSRQSPSARRAGRPGTWKKYCATCKGRRRP